MARTSSPVVAVVDDEASIRKALLRLLRFSGFEARGFASGPEFLDTLPVCHYDCVVMDLYMPEMAGLDVQQDQAFSAARLPTIFITAHDDPELRRKCMSVGGLAYLCKPFDDDELLRAVKDAMEK
jgi:FixJ family two-component response regulator